MKFQLSSFIRFLLGLVLTCHILSAQNRVASDYHVQAEDLLRILVFDEPSLTQEGSRVTQTGNITFPLLNAIPVAGRTVQQIQLDIEQRLKDGYIKSPHVSVQVLQYNEQFYTVMGEVKLPGIYPLPPEKKIDLVEAVAKANGFTPNAKEAKMELWRDGERKSFNYNDLLKTKEDDVKIFIRPGDKIQIPSRFF
jgi:polysaccharide export outer membrane protein